MFHYYYYNPKDDLQLVDLSSIVTEEVVATCSLGMTVHLIEVASMEDVPAPGLILSISINAIASEEAVSVPELTISDIGPQVIECSSIASSGSVNGINRLIRITNSRPMYDYYNNYRYESTRERISQTL